MLGFSRAAKHSEQDEADVDLWNEMPLRTKISAFAFYANYYGHQLHLLWNCQRIFREQDRSIVWLVGDSTLDNKHWLYADDYVGNKMLDPLNDPAYTGPAVNGMEEILNPPRCIQDVAYWFNLFSSSSSSFSSLVALNCATEASTLWDRRHGLHLLNRDRLVRDHITSRDCLVVSVGGNDLALRPSPRIIASLLRLRYSGAGSDASIDDFSHPSLRSLRDLFLDQTLHFVLSLCQRHRPRLVVVCLQYAPSLSSQHPSWADPVLRTLRYSGNPDDAGPRKVRRVLDAVYEHCTQEVARRVQLVTQGEVRCVSLNWSNVMDWTRDEEMYVSRVEPSVMGGKQMAKALWDIMCSEM